MKHFEFKNLLFLSIGLLLGFLATPIIWRIIGFQKLEDCAYLPTEKGVEVCIAILRGPSPKKAGLPDLMLKKIQIEDAKYVIRTSSSGSNYVKISGTIFNGTPHDLINIKLGLFVFRPNDDPEKFSPLESSDVKIDGLAESAKRLAFEKEVLIFSKGKEFKFDSDVQYAESVP